MSVVARRRLLLEESNVAAVQLGDPQSRSFNLRGMMELIFLRPGASTLRLATQSKQRRHIRTRPERMPLGNMNIELSVITANISKINAQKQNRPVAFRPIPVRSIPSPQGYTQPTIQPAQPCPCIASLQAFLGNSPGTCSWLTLISVSCLMTFGKICPVSCAPRDSKPPRPSSSFGAVMSEEPAMPPPVLLA